MNTTDTADPPADDALSVPCRQCGAQAGDRCRTAYGRRLPRARPHLARLREWIDR